MSTAPPTESRFTQYEQYFSSDALDIYSGRYAAIMHHFRCHDSPRTSVDIMNFVRGFGPDYPFAFLAVLKEHGHQYFQLYHTFNPFPTSRPTVWNGRLFATEGDVTMGNFITIEVPDDAFQMANAGVEDNVPANFDRARDIYNNNPGEDFVGPFADNEAQIRTARTRNFIPLPHKYARLFIEGRVPIRKGFHDLAAALEANNDLESCAPLVDWLLLAITRATAGAPTDLAIDPPPAVRADSALLAHRTKIVHDHLPGLSSGVSLTLAAAHQQLVQTVGRVVDEQRRTREEAQARAVQDKVKTIAKTLGAGVEEKLCIMCGVAAPDLLPPIWQRLAESKQDRWTLEQALNDTAAQAGKSRYAPIATAELTKRIKGMNWVGSDSNLLEDGINPFNLVLPNRSHGQQAEAEARNYDMLLNGLSITLSDVKTLKTSKVIIPESFSHMKAVLISHMIVWTTMVGETHPFVLSYGEFLHRFDAMEAQLEQELAVLDVSVWEPSYASLLRFVQMETHLYWDLALRSQILTPVPNFCEALDKIVRQNTSWIPNFPRRYWNPPTLDYETPSLVSTITTSTGGGTSGTDETKDLGKGKDKKKEAGEPVPNAKFNKVFEPFQRQLFNKTAVLRKLTSAKKPPTYTRGGKSIQMCASYHVKGSCWSTCNNKQDHQQHTTEEDEQLVLWCKESFPSST